MISYVDLYLIHWPAPHRIETWKALERLYKDGKTRAIGVSNYVIRHLEEIFSHSSITPAVNQFELSPFLYLKDLIEFCKSKKIVVEAYCGLTRGRRFNNPELKKLSIKYNKTPAQILLRWGLQHNIIEIPKSAHKDHIKENAEIFDFNILNDDMDILNNLNENFRVVDDPNDYE